MKARLPINKALKKRIAEEQKKQSKDSTRRLFKIFCIALNNTEGFGEVRLKRLLCEVSKIAAEHENDEIYWTHIDQRMKQLNLDFEEEKE